MGELPEIVEVRRVTVNPGDVVAVRLKGRVSMETADRLQRTLKTAFPDNRVLVLDDGAELDVLAPAPAEPVTEPQGERGGDA